MKDALVEVILRQQALKILVFVAHITDEFILRLDILWAYNTSVELGCNVLQLGQEEVALWRPEAQTQSFRLTLVSDKVISAQCERVAMVQLEAPLDMANGLVEPSLKIS
jgi:hypothetical protein